MSEIDVSLFRNEGLVFFIIISNNKYVAKMNYF